MSIELKNVKIYRVRVWHNIYLHWLKFIVNIPYMNLWEIKGTSQKSCAFGKKINELIRAHHFFHCQIKKETRHTKLKKDNNMYFATQLSVLESGILREIIYVWIRNFERCTQSSRLLW